MITEPNLEARPEQPYVGIRTQVPMQELETVILHLLREIFIWLETRGMGWVGAPFIRFHTIAMKVKLDVELGVPVATALSGDARVAAGSLPAGRYATLVYNGKRNGIKANALLLDWAAAHGLTWDKWDTADGEAFAGRYESYLTGPNEEPDPEKWQTEVAIRLADEQPR